MDVKVLFRLIVMRHAEAEPQMAGTDHARRLTARGRQDARSTGGKLLAKGWVPARMLASDSQRTRETAEGLAEAFASAGLAAPVAWHPPLYLGGLDAVEDLLHTADRGETTLLVLGHNPGFSEAAGLLAGRPAGLGTAHAALLSIEAADWAEAAAAAAGWKLEALLTP